MDVARNDGDLRAILSLYGYVEGDPINKVDPTGYSSRRRIFYIHGKHQRNHARRNVNRLQNRFIVSRHDVRNASAFRRMWESIRGNNRGNPIVVVNYHSSPTRLQGGIAASGLQRRGINTLLLLTCNGGHNDVRNNLARQFATSHNVGQIVAADGLHRRLRGTRGEVHAGGRNGGFRNNATQVINSHGRSIARAPRGLQLWDRNGNRIRNVGMRYPSVDVLLSRVGR